MKLNRVLMIATILVLNIAMTISVHAQTFRTLVNFTNDAGFKPVGSLTRGQDGNYYGVTEDGGTPQCNVLIECGGTVYKISAQKVLTTLYVFCSQQNCADGLFPMSGLVLGTDGNFYGTTNQGGNQTTNTGTIFKITPQGKLTTLHTFCLQSGCADGANPVGALIQAIDGNFYGTTSHGGSNDWGTVFRITPSGVLTTIYSFWPFSGPLPLAGLTYGPDGKFYGTTTTRLFAQIAV